MTALCDSEFASALSAGAGRLSNSVTVPRIIYTQGECEHAQQNPRIPRQLQGRFKKSARISRMTKPALSAAVRLSVARWLLIALGLLIQGHAVAFTKTLYLFSEVEGIVLRDGEPVVGALVEQEYHWHWGNQRRSSTAVTDRNGRFHFPTITGSSFTAQLFPHEPVITQYLRIMFESQSYEGWFHSKHNYEEKGEFGESPLRLQCDLKDEPGPHPEIGSFGICVPWTSPGRSSQ